MEIMIFIFPTIMVIFGLILWKFPPKKINAWYGYRTKRAMKNEKNWIFAQKECGKYWFFAGVFSLLISILILVIFKKTEKFSLLCGIITGIEGVLLLSVIPYTEIKLKKDSEEK